MSTQTPTQLGKAIARVRARYDADVIVAETEYPFTNDDADSPPNLLRPDTFVVGYPATPRGSVTIWSI